MNIQNKQEVYKLSVKEIDNLISQLEEGCQSLLFFQEDKKKVYSLSAIIGFLIDVRCEKMGIVL
jgi:hypothetical protein